MRKFRNGLAPSKWKPFSIIIIHTFSLDLNFYKCKKAFQQKLDIDAFNEKERRKAKWITKSKKIILSV